MIFPSTPSLYLNYKKIFKNTSVITSFSFLYSTLKNPTYKIVGILAKLSTLIQSTISVELEQLLIGPKHPPIKHLLE